MLTECPPVDVPMGWLTGINYSDNTTASFGNDGRGRRTSATDQNTKTTIYAYDDADRLTSVTDAATNLTQYNYDTENCTGVRVKVLRPLRRRTSVRP
jgi:YD repeat-containing protein